MSYNKPWWEAEKNELHTAVAEALNNTKKNQTGQDALDERHYRLYSGLPLYSAFTGGIFEADEIRFTSNVIQSGVNTMVSKITKNKIRPTFLTDDGDWGMQQQAKKLDKYVFGQFYKSKVYEESKSAFRDCGIFGDGFVKHWHDSDGKIHVKRTFKPSLVFDLAESLFDDPKTVYEVRVVNKETLKQKYPEHSLEIDAAKMSDMPFFSSDYEAQSELVVVVEAYRAAHTKSVKKKDGKINNDEPTLVPGRHFIGISTATFVDEPFKMEKVPYIRISFVPNALGYLSRGIAELITGHQVEINRTLKRISRAMNLMTSPAIFIDYMSEIIDTHFNNDVGTIIKFKDNPPVYNFPQGISPTIVEWYVMVYQKAFEEIGLSQLTAQSQKPQGLDSGKALREYNDIETERFAEVAQNWEQFHLDIAAAIIEHAKLIAKEGGETVVLSPEKMGAQKIDFKDIKLKDSEYIMQCYPTSMLPKTPAGRLAYIQEMIGAQMIDGDTGLSLLEFPDVSEVMSTKLAYIDDIKYTANLIIEKEEYMAPEPYQNLEFGLAYMNSTYLKMKYRGLPQDRLDLLQRWINDALALQQSMQEPPMDPAMEASPDLLTDAPTEEVLPTEAMPQGAI